jgi:hypothetical protein
MADSAKSTEATYTFAEITWAKRNRIIQKHTKYNKLTGDVESSDFIAIQAETIIASMHGQPQSLSHNVEKTFGRRRRRTHRAWRNILQNSQQPKRHGTGGFAFFTRAVRRGKPHSALVEFRLCQTFGWTPTELAKQPAKTVQEFCHILNVMDEIAEEEKRKRRSVKQNGTRSNL